MTARRGVRQRKRDYLHSQSAKQPRHQLAEGGNALAGWGASAEGDVQGDRVEDGAVAASGQASGH